MKRLTGLDLARAIVLLGMFAIHFNRSGVLESGDVSRGVVVEGLVSSVSVGFVLISGIALTLAMTGRTDIALTRRHLVRRAIVLLPLGFALQELDPTGVAVILQAFALVFVIAIPFVGRSDRVLAAAAIVLMAAGTVAFAVASADGLTTGSASRLLDDPGTTLASLFVTGTYPAITLGGVFLAGVWMGRKGMVRSPLRTTALLVATGVAVAISLIDVLGWWPSPSGDLVAALVDPGFDAKSPVWLVGAFAWQTVLVLGAVAVGDRMPRLARLGGLSGRIPLTAYAAHLLVIAIDPAVMRTEWLPGAALRAIATTIAATLFAAWWLRGHSRGPLEEVMVIRERREPEA